MQKRTGLSGSAIKSQALCKLRFIPIGFSELQCCTIKLRNWASEYSSDRGQFNSCEKSFAAIMISIKLH